MYSQNRRYAVRNFLVILLILIAAFSLLYFKVLVSKNGFFSFANFLQPFTLSEINTFHPFYNPFLDSGSTNSMPFSSFVSFTIQWLLLGVPSMVSNLYFGTKIFFLLTSVIYGLSFFYLTSIFTNRTSARVSGTLFFLFNPSTLVFYAGGDFELFVYLSMTFIGAVFLYRAMESKKFLHPYYLLSAVLLLLSFVLLQNILTGTIFYMVIIAYAVLFSAKTVRIMDKFIDYLKSLLALFINVIFLGMIFVLPVLFSSTSFLPGSTNALPLDDFIGNSLSLSSILTFIVTSSNITNSIVNDYGHAVYLIWYAMGVALMSLGLLGYLITRDNRSIFFSIVILVISILASGPSGPLAPLTIFLYLHFPGYQALNASYLWIWFLVIPIYSVSLTIMLSKIYLRDHYLLLRKDTYNVRKLAALKGVKPRNIENSRILKFILIVFIVIVMVIPILAQGYYGDPAQLGYGNMGIQQIVEPAWFNNLNDRLLSLTRNNGSGVLFNTITDQFWYYGNGLDETLVNPWQNVPQFRTAVLASYAPVKDTATNFYYWFYHLFYTNETVYSAEILSMVGVQYFVDIYDANSEQFPNYIGWSSGVNASRILVHEPGWEMIIQTQNYSIFKNEYYSGIDYYTANLSMVLGNYGALNDLAYLGINLADITPIFPTDLLASNELQQVLNHTNLVVLSGNNSIYSLILGISNSTILYPSNYANGELTNLSTSWINSETYYNAPDYGSLVPYAETVGYNSLDVPIIVNSQGKYNIFIKLYYSNNLTKGGAFEVLANGHLIRELNTNGSYQNETNCFLWVKTDAYLMKGRNVLTLQSLSGFNAVSELSVINSTNLQKATERADDFLSREKNNTVIIFNPQQNLQFGSSQYYFGNGIVLNYSKDGASTHSPMENTLFGYRTVYLGNEFLVNRYSYIENGASTINLYSSFNGLNTIIFAGLNKSTVKIIEITSPSYHLFVYGLSIAIAYTFIYFSAYSYVRKRYT